MSTQFGDTFSIKPVSEADFPAIKTLLQEMADYHNGVAETFAGDYPLFPLDEQLADAAVELREGRALFEMLLENGRPVGFCKASFKDGHGDIDYLYVQERLRGTGLGGRMTERMLAYLEDNGVRFIELRVVHGNPARSFYEKYGFKVRSLLMAREK